MKLKLMLPVLALAWLTCVNHVTAQGTAFTYQGDLYYIQTQPGSYGHAPDGEYTMQFTLYNAPTNGTVLAGPITVTNVPVTNGLFTATMDFGAGAFTGANCWLQIAVATNGGAMSVLNPLQQITPAPYAIYAQNAGALPGYVAEQNSAGAPDLIGGSPANFVSNSVVGATIGGGGATNYLGTNYSNSVTENFGTVGGGGANTANGQWATISGGLGNAAIGNYAFIGGGWQNTASNYDVVCGGQNNYVGADYSGIVSGAGNVVHENGPIGSLVGWVFIGSGQANMIEGSSYDSTIVAGEHNSIADFSWESFIGDGVGNLIESNAYDSVICGGAGNSIDTNAEYSFIGGGLSDTINACYASTIGGGSNNSIIGYAEYAPFEGPPYTGPAPSESATISGGAGNKIYGASPYSTIGGGEGNTINNLMIFPDSTLPGETIAGGFGNAASGIVYGYATVGGGSNNLAQGDYSTVPGGENNTASGSASFAAGTGADAGSANTFVWSDGSTAPFISTGIQQFLIQASGGVGINTNAPQQALSVNGGLNVDQGDNNAGNLNGNGSDGFSPAVNNYGLSFGNRSGEGIASKRTTGAGQFSLEFYTAFAQRMVILQNGDVGIGISAPVYPLEMASGAYCSAGGSWSSASDRNAKKDFTAVNGREVLDKVSALPITEWGYKIEPDSVRHIGPMAQDFHAAFGLNGGDDKHISTVDEGGVALAAIQGLNQKLDEKDAVIQQQAADIADLKARLEKLEQAINSRNKGGQ